MIGPTQIQDRCLECLLFGAIQGLDDGLLLANPEGRIFLVNRRAEELLGVSAATVLGAPMRSVLRHRPLLDLWASAARDDQPAVAEMGLPPLAAVRASVVVCRGASGEAIGRALTIRDVSRERTLQVELSTGVARRLLDLAGGGEEGADVPRLTRREDDVLRLLAAGMSNAAIAARLNVSVNTVASHLKHLYPKIGAANRSQATAFALSHGIRPATR